MATQPALAQPQSATASPLAFDVVSIRRNISGAREMTRQSAANTDDITMTNVPLALVVYYAYFINDENQIHGLPDWTVSERYDVTAKVAPEDLAQYRALTNRQRAAMLQAVLADRFKLQAHHESKDRPVYALVVAKNGPKLKEAQPGEIHPNTAKANAGAFAKGGTIFITAPGQITGEAASTADLALMLSNAGKQLLGRPVVDRTGLTAKYDFTLQFDPALALGSDTDGDRPDAQEGIASIVSTLQSQLGLNLQPAAAPTDLLVIDHIERPSAN